MGVEDDLLSILNGQAVPVRDTLDVRPESSREEKFVPMTKTNMCYICGAVIFDESGRILLIQEAKKSCRGEWYLPIGRLERNETLIAGAHREVKEEAGIDCEFTTLLSVEVQNSTWIRFVFFGTIKDGTKLKTTEEQDSESIQAKMFTLEEIQLSRQSVRASDIFKLIETAQKYCQTDISKRRPPCFPVISPHMRLIHRIVIVDRATSKDQPISILVNKDDGDHIPITLLNYSRDGHIAASVYAVLKDAVGSNLSSSGCSVRMCGILGAEHKGTGELEDGLCLTSLVSLDIAPASVSSDSVASASPPAVSSASYAWCPITDMDLIRRIEEAAGKGKLVPFLS
ncbi:8-oxo-dGDP phosphatase nudt18-like [Plakobranchus ocellatus]|uniref:8-oxo-dGDP phosphatase nudt18-like n=1 Tax=Plakobranchus ocellatus TaxID=259542 RepID=A0AAV4DD45_9GAST|nr:8-oxo-dGDP phosphatase nudt18-like [Plakobranchus ocellatus]